MLNRIGNSESGITVIETMIAMLVVLLTVSGLATAVMQISHSQAKAKVRANATSSARTLMDRVLADQSWARRTDDCRLAVCSLVAWVNTTDHTIANTVALNYSYTTVPQELTEPTLVESLNTGDTLEDVHYFVTITSTPVDSLADNCTNLPCTTATAATCPTPAPPARLYCPADRNGDNGADSYQIAISVEVRGPGLPADPRLRTFQLVETTRSSQAVTTGSVQVELCRAYIQIDDRRGYDGCPLWEGGLAKPTQCNLDCVDWGSSAKPPEWYRRGMGPVTGITVQLVPVGGGTPINATSTSGNLVTFNGLRAGNYTYLLSNVPAEIELWASKSMPSSTAVSVKAGTSSPTQLTFQPKRMSYTMRIRTTDITDPANVTVTDNAGSAFNFKMIAKPYARVFAHRNWTNVAVGATSVTIPNVEPGLYTPYVLKGYSGKYLLSLTNAAGTNYKSIWIPAVDLTGAAANPSPSLANPPYLNIKVCDKTARKALLVQYCGQGTDGCYYTDGAVRRYISDCDFSTLDPGGAGHGGA